MPEPRIVEIKMVCNTPGCERMMSLKFNIRDREHAEIFAPLMHCHPCWLIHEAEHKEMERRWARQRQQQQERSQ